MPLFRKRTIFHVEEALPDPEDLKLRFRRRVLLLTFIGFLVVLAIPVGRDLQGELLLRQTVRAFAEKILETRTLASIGREPISLSVGSDNRSWRRIFHGTGQDCSAQVPSPEEAWTSPVTWKLQLQKENGETFSGHSLCAHPTLGLMLDSVPVAEGKLLLTALGGEQKSETPVSLLVSQFGADIQVVTH